MNKKKAMLLLLTLIFIPKSVFAQENNVLSETTKYYKTITQKNNLSINAYSSNTVNHNNSYSVEVTEYEYEHSDEMINTNSATVETTYKKMTTSIEQNGSNYRYKVVLNWKNMPSVRSYDIIGIGMNSNVRVSNTPYFEQYYCISGGSCYSSTAYTPKTGSQGAGASFKLMSGSLSTLRLTFHYNVAKNTNSTLYGLDAYGDYSHATSSISSSNAQNYWLSTGGISLDSSISGYYDSIQSANASLTGISW